jgi:succinate dehydrogenase/fumarate reductase cytochrome b subunit
MIGALLLLDPSLPYPRARLSSSRILEPMRRAPSPLIGVLAALGYVAIVAGLWATAMVIHALWDFGSLGLSGSDAASTPFSVVGGLLVYPTMIAGVVAAVVTARRVDREAAEVATAPANA